LLCFKCHDEKTDKDKGNIAKAKRIEAKHIGADRPKGTIPNRGFPKSDRPHRDRQSLPTKGLFK
jgi:hypothetical protein